MTAYKKMLAKLLFCKPEAEAAVVIPIYKPFLSNYETVALDRCLRVLGHHPIVIIAPDGLSLDAIDILKLHHFEVTRFPAHFFTNITGYNRLMLSIDFYKTFLKYRYILLHQLDAFVFSDQLLDWCKLSYDYIGAPWIGVNWLPDFNKVRYGYFWRFLGTKERVVGNGGFSLRKVRSSILALIILEKCASTWHENNYEDLFWSFAVPEYLPFFRIPEIEVALKFAFEREPRICFTRNSKVLPFGCHAWEKHGKDFWHPFFEGLGYDI